jgi:hypothetical protein
MRKVRHCLSRRVPPGGLHRLSTGPAHGPGAAVGGSGLPAFEPVRLGFNGTSALVDLGNPQALSFTGDITGEGMNNRAASEAGPGSGATAARGGESARQQWPTSPAPCRSSMGGLPGQGGAE